MDLVNKIIVVSVFPDLLSLEKILLNTTQKDKDWILLRIPKSASLVIHFQSRINPTRPLDVRVIFD